MLKNKKFICLALIFSAFFIFAGCQGERKEASKGEEKIPVKVIRIEPKTIRDILDYVGDIRAQEEALVYPKVSGKIIEKLKEDGDVVKKGDIIAYIDRDEVGFKFEKAPVESPLGGVVGRVYVDIGTNVNIQTPVALVIDMDKVEIELDVPAKYLPQISLGQDASVSVDAYPKEEFIGKVSKISPVVDLDTRTAPIEIVIPNKDHRLKSGMLAKVHLIIKEERNVPVILKEAIMGKEPELYVFVIENGKAYMKKIALGIHEGPNYQVKEGLKTGDLVVVLGQQRLYEEAPVIIEKEQEAANP